MNSKVQIKELESYLSTITLPAQREAITADDDLVVVSAGAGTGKTWTLAWRFVWAIVIGRASVDQILTLTFTDKAATEMRERIGKLMTSLLVRTSHLPDVSQRLKEAIERLDESYISTIHSFASRVIKESGLTLDLDPASRLVSAPEEDLFWFQMADCLDRLDSTWIGRNLSGQSWHWGRELLEENMVQKVIDGYGPRTITDFARGLMGLSASQGKRPEDIMDWAEKLPDRHEETGKSIVRLFYKKWLDEWHLWFGGDGTRGILSLVEIDGKTALVSRLDKLIRDYSSMPDEENITYFMASICETLKGARGKLADEIGGLLSEGKIKDHRDNLLSESFLWSLARDGWPQWEIDISSCLLKLASLCWLCWESRKNGRGLIAFDDMIVNAKRALEENGPYSKRFKEVLVDEFQDTNGLQDNMISTIIDGGGGKLFLVGDLKQSIYRFRHADLNLFGSYIERARTGAGRYVKLDVSFRTRDLLLKDVNELFSSVWCGGLGQGLNHRYERLEPPVDADWYETRQNCDLPSSISLIAEKGEEREPIETLRDRSSDELARYLIDIRDRGASVWDKSEEKLRPVRWRDMAILAPARTQFPSIQRVLGDRWGLPLHFEKNTGYYARMEVQDTIALLMFLADPEDDLSLALFISSPLSGVPLGESEQFLNGSVDREEPLHIKLKYSFPDLYKKLMMWREEAQLKGASSVVEELLREADSLNSFAEWKRRGVAANLRRTVDLLREYETTMGRGITGCVQWLSESLYRQAKEEEAGAVGPDEDVIRVMTVHASKGLEFPLVVLSGCDYIKSGRSSVLTPSSHIGVALSRDLEDEEKPIGKSLHKLLEEQAELEEWQRLFYVGATRARDCLILTGVEEPPLGSWLHMAGDFGEVLPDLPEPERIKEEGILSEEGPSLPLPKSDEGLERISATSWGMFRYCPYGWRLRFRQGLNLSWEQRDGESGGGADMGSLTHWILARWDFTRDGLAKLMARDESVVPNGLRNLWKDQSCRENIEKWLLSLLTSSEGKRISRLARENMLRREVPFRVSIGETLLVGAIDLMWEEEGVIYIRDYKITSEGGAPDGLYEDQLKFYGLVATTVFGDKPVDMGLLHLRGDCELHSVTLDLEEKWATIRNSIEEDIKKAAHGPWIPEREKCSTCPFRSRCLAF